MRLSLTPYCAGNPVVPCASIGRHCSAPAHSEAAPRLCILRHRHFYYTILRSFLSTRNVHGSVFANLFDYFPIYCIIYASCNDGRAWFIALVLKTRVPRGTEGSNPSRCASGFLSLKPVVIRNKRNASLFIKALLGVLPRLSMFSAFIAIIILLLIMPKSLFCSSSVSQYNEPNGASDLFN